MRLENCVLDIKQVAARPPILEKPEPEWVEARDAGQIPEFLYRFYCTAGYFSLNKAPRFLDDPDRQLFSFLGSLVRGILDALVEADDLTKSIKEDMTKAYSPVKELRGIPFDLKAAPRKMRSFRYLVVSLSSALDQLAECVSIFFHGDIDKLTVGRAAFSLLRDFTRQPFTPSDAIVSPKERHFDELHRVLSQHLNADGGEAGWFDLFQLYRHKLAHLGGHMFPVLEFHDREGNFYPFLPRTWPLFLQEHMRLPGDPPDKDVGTIRELAERLLVHQDLGEYSIKLLARVCLMVNDSFRVLCAAYAELKDFELNSSALRSLRDKREGHSFLAFT